MYNYFTFGTIVSKNYGVYISGSEVFNAPEREFELIHIPGRDGDLIGIERRLPNIELTYPAFIFNSFQSQIAQFRNLMLAVSKYTKLSDSYHSGEYRMAVPVGGVLVDPTRSLHAGKFDIRFSCKPQRYLDSGDTPIENPATLTNPTLFPSKPLIRVYGYGDLAIGTQIITVTDAFAYVDIDCDLMECYYGTQNANLQVAFSGNDFPLIPTGTTTISHDNTITKVVITPRWWKV